ncbi:unnamed protein product [Ilex paraguariensis]|uniref:non-specific serine/threonine protein kinase n=1 Tax=Ilex paraguariensis TaxID=185542 RepID=A0ABC8TDY4_9AQUA
MLSTCLLVMNNKESLVIFSLFLPFLAFVVASSDDTLQQGAILTSSSYLVSAKKVFTLGFFSPPYSKENYLGIWYTNDSQSHPVWVGNRNTPIHNNSGVLAIDNTGNMIITHNGGDTIELYTTQTRDNKTATLLDSGNFVVREVNSNGTTGHVLWQSFDYPTDTLLPGMKLGVSHRTGRNWSLTSWLAEGVPAPGAFTLDWDSRRGRLIVRRRGVIYWTSGVLKDKAFEFIGKSDPRNVVYDYINVTSEEEEYFSYSLIKDSRCTPEGRKAISGWMLDYNGQINDQDRPPIARVDLCYGYKTRGSGGVYEGCELWEQPTCRNSNRS